MSITDLMELGDAGKEIIYLLDEILESVESPRDFEDTTAQCEYVERTIELIKLELIKLKQK